jgi:hypothetical protein
MRPTHPAVLVDEVGYLTYGTDAAYMLFHVVNERHRRQRPMIFTTQESLKAWGRVLHDDDWAQAMGHRVTQLGTSSPQVESAAEIVLNAADATAVRSGWFFDTDPTDNHFILRQNDGGRPKLMRPEIVPEHYFEMEFYAEAARDYRL